MWKPRASAPDDQGSPLQQLVHGLPREIALLPRIEAVLQPISTRDQTLDNLLLRSGSEHKRHTTNVPTTVSPWHGKKPDDVFDLSCITFYCVPSVIVFWKILQPIEAQNLLSVGGQSKAYAAIAIPIPACVGWCVDVTIGILQMKSRKFFDLSFFLDGGRFRPHKHTHFPSLQDILPDID